MRSIVGLLVAAFALGSVAQATAQSNPARDQREPRPGEQTGHQLELRDERLLKKYVWSTLGPAGVMSSALFAGADQWRHRPEQWTVDGPGFAERFASNYAAGVIGGTTKYTIAHMFNQDPSFEKCHCRGLGRRVGHAVTSPFVARGANGRRGFSMATVGGIAAENVIPAVTWYPRPSNATQGMYSASIGVLTKMAVDVVREFAPQRR